MPNLLAILFGVVKNCEEAFKFCRLTKESVVWFSWEKYFFELLFIEHFGFVIIVEMSFENVKQVFQIIVAGEIFEDIFKMNNFNFLWIWGLVDYRKNFSYDLPLIKLSVFFNVSLDYCMVKMIGIMSAFRCMMNVFVYSKPMSSLDTSWGFSSISDSVSDYQKFLLSFKIFSFRIFRRNLSIPSRFSVFVFVKGVRHLEKTFFVISVKLFTHQICTLVIELVFFCFT